MRCLGLVVIAAAFVVAGCSRSYTLMLYPWQSGQYKYDLAIDGKPRQLDKTTFTLSVYDMDGNPIQDCSPTVDLTMPSMTMPPSIIRLTQVKPGIYAGKGQYTMSGQWSVKVDIDRGGKPLSTHTVPVTVQ